MVAFGDKNVILFTGAQKPAESGRVELTDEVKSIFYDDTHYGLIFDNKDKENPYRIEIYNTKSTKHRDLFFSMDYTQVEFLDNDDICVRSDEACEIFNKKGIKKLSYKFDKNLYKVISGSSQRNYTFILEGETRRVKLK